MRIDGLDPAAQPLEVRKRFGIVFQDPSLDHELTAYENMDLHGVLYHVPRKRAASSASKRCSSCSSCGTGATSLVKTFSGGMRRRLEIARGLLHTPKILFLDEPTLGLDPQSRNQLWTHVKHLNETEGVTVFLTTHYMDEAERVGARVAIIDHGRIVAQGSAQELQRPDGSRFARRRVPDAHGHDDPRRGEHERGPDAADGEDVDRRPAMNVIYMLWLREVKRYMRSRAQIIGSLAQPLLYLLVLGFGFGADVPAGGAGQLPAVRRARRHRDGHPVHVDLLRDRPAVGPAVRLPQGDARRAGPAPADHDRPHARRRDDRDHPGHARARRLHDRRLPARRAGLPCRSRSCSWRSSPSCSRRSAPPSARRCGTCRASS